jgi:hypothetical protein
MKTKKVRKVSIDFTLFNILTTKPKSFLKDIKRVCNKYAVKLPGTTGRKDYYYSWEAGGE